MYPDLAPFLDDLVALAGQKIHALLELNAIFVSSAQPPNNAALGFPDEQSPEGIRHDAARDHQGKVIIQEQHQGAVRFVVRVGIGIEFPTQGVGV